MRWADDIHDYLDATTDTTETNKSDAKKNEHPKDNEYWMTLARHGERWTTLEKGYMKKER